MSWQCEPCDQGSHGNCLDTDCECEYCWDSNQEAKKFAAIARGEENEKENK